MRQQASGSPAFGHGHAPRRLSRTLALGGGAVLVLAQAVNATPDSAAGRWSATSIGHCLVSAVLYRSPRLRDAAARSCMHSCRHVCEGSSGSLHEQWRAGNDALPGSRVCVLATRITCWQRQVSGGRDWGHWKNFGWCLWRVWERHHSPQPPGTSAGRGRHRGVSARVTKAGAFNIL